MSGDGQSSPPKGDLRLGIGISGLFFYQFWTPLSAPFAIGGMMDSLHLSASAAGMIASVEIFTFSLSMIFLRGIFERTDIRRVAAIGLVIAVIANLASSFTDNLIGLGVLRFIAGAGAGAAARAGLVAITTAARVDRTAAALSVVNTLLMAALLSLGAVVSEHAHLAGLYQFFAALGVLSALPLLLIPPRRAIPQSAATNFLAEIASPLVLAMIAMSFGFSAVWAFAERIGIESGLSVSQVGAVIGATALPGVFGGIGAFALAARGREKLFAGIGVAAVGLASAALAMSMTPAFYIVVQVALAIAYVFVQPFLLALAAQLDKSGTLASSMTGWAQLVSAAAPAAAGFAIEGIGFHALVMLPLVCTIAAVCFLYAYRSPEISPPWTSRPN